MAKQPECLGYTVTGVAGVGGSGAVWTAQSPEGDQVVIRVLPVDRAGDCDGLTRRIAAVQSLRHPALAPLRESLALPSGRTALVSDLIDGTTLATMQVARGGLPKDECLSIGRALLEGLSHMHAQGVVHGDVAPANIMLVFDEESMDRPEPTLRPVLVDLVTLPGQEHGTPGFRAPEVGAGGPARAASDVYAVATMLVWLATATDRTAVRAELSHLLKRDPQRRPGADVAAQYLEKYRTPIRPADHQALAAATLRDHAARAATIAIRGRRPRTKARHRRRRPLRYLAGIGAIILAAGMTWVVTQDHRSSQAQEPVAAQELVADQEPTATAEPLADRLTELTSIRDQALNDGDPQLLATVTTPGSAAARADTALLRSLTTAGERVNGYRSSLSDVEVARADDDQAQVRAQLSQAAHVRVAADGSQRAIDAQPSRCMLFDLARHDEHWQVAAVRRCEG